jgi:hypothetical protein
MSDEEVEQLTADLMAGPRPVVLPPWPTSQPTKPTKPLPQIPKVSHYQPLPIMPPPPITRYAEEQEQLTLQNKPRGPTLLQHIEACVVARKPLDWDYEGRILPSLGKVRSRISGSDSQVYTPQQPEWLQIYNSAGALWLDRDNKPLPRIMLPAELLSTVSARYDLKDVLSGADDVSGAIAAIDKMSSALLIANSKSSIAQKHINSAARGFKVALVRLGAKPATNGRRMRVYCVLYCMARMFEATGTHPTMKQIDRVVSTVTTCNWMQVTQRRETSAGSVHLWSVVRTFLDWYLIDGIDWCSPKMRLENTTRNIREFIGGGGAVGFARDWITVNAAWIIIALCIVVVALVIYNTVLLKEHDDDESEDHECSETS